MTAELTDRSVSTSIEIRRRDSEASRARILSAAALAFALDGFDATSMGRIAADAGVSSGLPAYFFGDKQGLHDAVIDHQFTVRENVLAPMVERVRIRLATAAVGDDPVLRACLTEIVAGYSDFLAAHPHFVRLMAWEALYEGRRTGPARPAHSRAVQEALEAILDAHSARFAPAIRRQLLITTVGLCFFPDAHADTMLAGLRIDPAEPRWRAARVRHVVDVLAAVVGPSYAEVKTKPL